MDKIREEHCVNFVKCSWASNSWKISALFAEYLCLRWRVFLFIYLLFFANIYVRMYIRTCVYISAFNCTSAYKVSVPAIVIYLHCLTSYRFLVWLQCDLNYTKKSGDLHKIYCCHITS